MVGRSDRLVPTEEVFGGASGGGSWRAEEYQASGAQEVRRREPRYTEELYVA